MSSQFGDSFVIRARPGAGTDRVVVSEDGKIWVYVRAKPEGGRANEAVLLILAKYLKIPASRLRIFAGGRSFNKTIRVV